MPADAGVSPHDRTLFAQIRHSTAWADRNSPHRQGRLPRMPAMATIAPAIFLVMFIAIAGFIGLMALGMAGIVGFAGHSMVGPLGGGIAIMPAVMALMPAGFVVLGVFLLTKHFSTISSFRNAPVESHAVLIAGKRTQVSGGGHDSSASTSYFVTAEFENGRREEYAAMTPDLYARIREGDAGVLFVRSRFALDFDRVAS